MPLLFESVDHQVTSKGKGYCRFKVESALKFKLILKLLRARQHVVLF